MKHPHFARVGFVLLALVASTPANACQLVCQVTLATYDGNLGGLAGADAKCAAEFTGFKFARSGTIVATMPSPILAMGIPWVGGYPTQNTMTCSTWTSTSGSGAALSSVYNGYGISDYTIVSGSCSAVKPLLCCNM